MKTASDRRHFSQQNPVIGLKWEACFCLLLCEINTPIVSNNYCKFRDVNLPHYCCKMHVYHARAERLTGVTTVTKVGRTFSKQTICDLVLEREFDYCESFKCIYWTMTLMWSFTFIKPSACMDRQWTEHEESLWMCEETGKSKQAWDEDAGKKDKK